LSWFKDVVLLVKSEDSKEYPGLRKAAEQPDLFLDTPCDARIRIIQQAFLHEIKKEMKQRCVSVSINIDLVFLCNFAQCNIHLDRYKWGCKVDAVWWSLSLVKWITAAKNPWEAPVFFWMKKSL
jgi:hypothetical protein